MKKAYYNLAEVLIQGKKYSKGVDLFSQALRYNNRNDMIWFYFAEFSKNVGSADWAMDAYKNAIKFAINDEHTNRFADTLKAVENRMTLPASSSSLDLGNGE